ncbi:MAG: ADOP family duplicated permease [Gemmatimonadales bacterium]
MSLWRQATRGLRRLFDRDAADRDVAAEVQHYLDQATAAGIARGLDPEAARRAAQLELGNATSVREAVITGGWEHVLGTVAADVRQAIRRLRQHPGFTAVSVITLALGVGASTAVFSAVNPILFAALPYPDANRIVMITDFGAGNAPADVTFGTYLELAARTRSFSALAVADRWQPSLTGTGSDAPERLHGQRISADFFRALGVPPAVGRDFAEDDAQPGGPRLAIVSDRFVRRRAGGASAIIGRALMLNGDPYTVVGIMPPSFDNVLDPAVDIWAPLPYRLNAPFQSAEWGHHLHMVARLTPGVTLEQARREVASIAGSPLRAFVRPPWASLSAGMLVTGLQDAIARSIKPVLLAIVGGVLLLLAIAAVNVTNLLLARGAQRSGEFAVRAALGAGRRRLVRQVLTESLVLALLGGALGVVLAQIGVRALILLSPAQLPRLGAIRVDGAVLAFTLLLTTGLGVVVGLLPALQGTRRDPAARLQLGSRRTVGGHQMMRRVLVVTEIALALVLLIGAGLLWRSIDRLLNVPPGFDAGHLLTMQVTASGHRYDADSARFQFFEQTRDAVLRVPGVTAAAFTSQLPLSGDVDTYGAQFASQVDQSPNDAPAAFRYVVTPGYFRTMHIALRRGRLLAPSDDRSSVAVAVINESYARQVFGQTDPIGQRLRAGPEIGDSTRPWHLVVGVVADVKQAGLAGPEPNAFYVPMGQWPWVDNVQSLVVRTSVDARALAPAVRNAVWSVDREPVSRIATMDDLIAASEAERHFALVVFQTFAAAALVLAAVGIYGVLTGSVTERTREIGVRSALGASRAEIVGLVARQALQLAAMGGVLGLAGAIVASAALTSLLYGISRLDPATYVGVVVLVLGVAAAAAWVPAWRAARVDPAITLRSE